MRYCVRRGFSTIEILLAGALFVVFAWGVVEVLLTGLVMDRLGEETTVATHYATDGLEAVRALEQEDFEALVLSDGTGITKESDQWVFSGTEDVFDDTYTRVILLEEVKRDDDGVITEEGGAVDPDTIHVTVTVTWERSVTQSDSVVLQTYATRFRSQL